MQPVQIRMNAAVVLIVLLLAVPLQLFLSHYLQQVYLESSLLDGEAVEKAASRVDRDGQIVVTDQDSRINVQDDLETVRADAMERLGVSLKHMAKNIKETFRYYSTWEHLKELFVIPYKKRQHNEEEGEMLHVSRNENGEVVVTLRKSPPPQKSQAKDKTNIKSLKYKSKDSSTTSASSSSSSKTTTGSTTSKTDSTKAQENNPARSETKLKEVVEPGTSHAKEVVEYLNKEVYFTRSKQPRSSKPRHVKYSVGQVVKHVQDSFYGVIIGWDEVAKTPEDWLKRHYSHRKYIEQSPHYLVLLDTHVDASGVPFHYIPQEDLELVDGNVQIRAPELNEYFEGFKNRRHIPRPWLRERYPDD